MYIESIGKSHNTSEPEDGSQNPKGYILLVEDHDINQILIKTMIERLGYQTELAVDGAEAVGKIDQARSENTPVDLILMDIQMPVMDGYEATRMIRASGVLEDSLPIVAITANADQDDIERCYASGMQDHIAKPVMMNQLKRVLLERISRNETTEEAPSGSNNNLSDELVAKYCNRRDQALTALANLVRVGTFCNHELTEVSDHLHKLAGTAAMFDEAELGSMARFLESGIADWKVSERPQKIRDVASAMAVIAKNSAQS